MEVVVVVTQRVAELTGVKGEAAADMVEREVVIVAMVQGTGPKQYTGEGRRGDRG